MPFSTHVYWVIFSESQLTVTVQGPRPENVLFLIHEVLESLITESYHGVTYDYYLPCPDCINKGVMFQIFKNQNNFIIML
jgi:hypothetical protein